MESLNSHKTLQHVVSDYFKHPYYMYNMFRHLPHTDAGGLLESFHNKITEGNPNFNWSNMAIEYRTYTIHTGGTYRIDLPEGMTIKVTGSW